MIDMRILHVYKLYSPVRGGVISVMQTLIDGLKTSSPSRVLVSTQRGMGRSEWINGTHVRRVFSFGTLLSMPLAPTYIFWLWYELRHADVIDYHAPFPLIDLAVSLFLPKRIKLVVHWHADITSQKITGRLIRPLVKRCLRRADKIVVATPFHIEHSPMLGPFKNKCAVIPFGIDVTAWKNDDDDVSAQTSQYRNEYPRLVLAVGRLVPYKGFEYLIRSMKNIHGELIIVGTGELRNKLGALAEHCGVADRIVFFENASGIQLRALLRACRLLALPSVTRAEAFGIVQLEAMACGKPIVNTTIHGGIGWVARDGKEALTVPPKDTTALANAINKLLDDQQLADRLGRNGYKRVKEELSIQRFCDKTFNVYSEVMTNNKT